MNTPQDIPILALSKKSETAITELFFHPQRIKGLISSTHELAVQTGHPDLIRNCEVLANATEALSRQVHELRTVFSEVFWHGFIYALGQCKREDLIGAYPEALKVTHIMEIEVEE